MDRPGWHPLFQIAPLLALLTACGEGSTPDPAGIGEEVFSKRAPFAAPGVKVVAEADATVRSSSPTTNLGEVKWLRAQQTNDEVHLRFQVPALPAITRATLLLYVTEPSANAANLYVGTSTTWSETGITWNNRPTTGPVLGSILQADLWQWVSLDVTAAVASGKRSFVLRGRSSDGVTFASRESGARPTLVVETGGQSSAAIAWRRWETVLTSSRSYANPYRDVTVEVEFRHTSGQSIKANGFWDGGNTFRLRAMFPAVGAWTWSTTCSDTGNVGLHGQGGTIAVAGYTGSNPLYTHGYLRTSSDERHLELADGTPFLWFGDTAWSAPIAATQAEWEQYILKRSAQRFNVIQVHTRDGWVNRTRDRNGNPPFHGSGATLAWNPEYWRGVEQKVQFANDHGLLVFFAAVRQPGPGFPDTDTSQVRRFARMLAARLMGNFVVYSPVADDVWTALADASGEELAASSSIHLITAHPRFQYAPTISFHGKGYTDFAGLQSGAGWQHDPYLKQPSQPFSAVVATRQSIEWPLALYDRTPRKPVINLEIPYDGKALQDNDPKRYQQPYPARLPRSTACLTLLSGAKGVTYGCSDIWSWGIPISWDGADWSFETALNQKSAVELQHLFELFSGLQWWRLVPRHDLVLNQSADWLKRMAFAATPDGRQAVAYLPDNTAINLQLSTLSGPLAVKWYNPVTYVWKAGPSVAAGAHSFAKPAGWGDAVLVLSTTP